MVFLNRNRFRRRDIMKKELGISDNFGKTLKKLRKQRGYTLEQLSELTGISPSYLNRLEKGTRRSPGYIVIIKLANSLNVNPQLLAGSNLKTSQNEAIGISELLFANQIEHKGEVLSAIQKEVLLDIVEKILEVRWEKDSILSELQEIGELISELKEQ